MQRQDDFDDEMELDLNPTTHVDMDQRSAQDADFQQSTIILWGSLVPCNPHQSQIDFSKTKNTYKIGRNSDPSVGNDFVFPGMKISNQHCEILWNGCVGAASTITVYDHSTNGTFINGEKIGKGRYAVLKNGDEIAFGMLMRNLSADDCRFIYCHLAYAK